MKKAMIVLLCILFSASIFVSCTKAKQNEIAAALEPDPSSSFYEELLEQKLQHDNQTVPMQ